MEDKDLTIKYNNGIQENPLFKGLIQKGEKYEEIGNYENALNSYKKILDYHSATPDHRVAAYNIIGLYAVIIKANSVEQRKISPMQRIIWEKLKIEKKN